MKKIVMILTAVILVCGLSFSFASEWKNTEISDLVALPKKINIIAPDPSVPPQIAALSGRWEGRWEGGQIPVVFIIEKMNEKNYEGYYCWGRSQYTRSDYQKIKGGVVTGPNGRPAIKLDYMSGRGNVVIFFEISDDLKKIMGFYISSGNTTNTAILYKIEE